MNEWTTTANFVWFEPITSFSRTNAEAGKLARRRPCIRDTLVNMVAHSLRHRLEKPIQFAGRPFGNQPNSPVRQIFHEPGHIETSRDFARGKPKPDALNMATVERFPTLTISFHVFSNYELSSLDKQPPHAIFARRPRCS